MASDNDALLDVISLCSNSSGKISNTVKNKHYSTPLEDGVVGVSNPFQDFRSALWAKRAELNPPPQNPVEEVPSIVVGDTAVFRPRRPRM